jgi:hypothetical protein
MAACPTCRLPGRTSAPVYSGRRPPDDPEVRDEELVPALLLPHETDGGIFTVTPPQDAASVAADRNGLKLVRDALAGVEGARVTLARARQPLGRS